MSSEGAYGVGALQASLRQRIADQIAAQDRMFRQNMEMRTANRADALAEDQIKMREELQKSREFQQSQTMADKSETQARNLGELVPPGPLPVDASIASPVSSPEPKYVGQLRSVGLIDPSTARSAVEEGPLLPGDTGAARGVTKLPSQKQLDTNTDNARLDATATANAENQAEMRRLQGEANDIRRDAANKPKEMSPTQQFQAVNKLQRDYEKIRTPVREMDRALRIMRAGMEQAKGGNLNAGSQQILVTFQKLLDPTSVVRESEYARSGEGQALIKRLEGIPQRITKGGPGVTMSELEQFVKAGEQMYGAVKGFGASKRKQLERTAQAYQLDPSLIFDDDGDTAPAADAAAKPTAADLLKKYGGK